MITFNECEISIINRDYCLMISVVKINEKNVDNDGLVLRFITKKSNFVNLFLFLVDIIHVLQGKNKIVKLNVFCDFFKGFSDEALVIPNLF